MNTQKTEPSTPRPPQVARYLLAHHSAASLRDTIDAACGAALTEGKARDELASHAFVLCGTARRGLIAVADELDLRGGEVRYGWCARADIIRALESKAKDYATASADHWSNPAALRTFRGPPPWAQRGGIIVCGEQIMLAEERY